jgi:hypothetical protein
MARAGAEASERGMDFISMGFISLLFIAYNNKINSFGVKTREYRVSEVEKVY